MRPLSLACARRWPRSRETTRSTGEHFERSLIMRCPFCSHEDTQVVETRDSDEGDVVRRRRRCHSCDKRFTTYERAEIALPSVVKKDGTRAEFDREKLRASMTLALRKRPVSVEQIDAAMERIQEKLLNSGAREVASARLG